MKKVTLLLLCFAVFSCNKEADFTKVQKGMTIEQVVEIVGEPIEKKEIPFIGKFYKYEHQIILFHNDSVTRCEDKEKFLKGMGNVIGKTNEDIEKIDNAIEEYKNRK